MSYDTIYEMNHPTIKLSSLNRDLINHFERILADVTADEIKLNVDGGSHAMLVRMGRAGECPMWEEYLKVRGWKDREFRRRYENTDNWDKPFAKSEIERDLNQEILNSTGWVLEKRY